MVIVAKGDLIDAVHFGDLKKFVENFESQYLNMDDFSCKATLLHVVVDGKSVDIVRFLVEQGADLNKRAGVYGANPVTYAADEGKLEVVKVLVEAGSELDTSHPSRNPLLKAAYSGHLEVVEYLLSTGMDAHACYLVPTGALVNAFTQAEKSRNATRPL